MKLSEKTTDDSLSFIYYLVNPLYLNKIHFLRVISKLQNIK